MISQRQSLARSKKLLLSIFGLALTAACAASPEDIAAKYASDDQYQGWNCIKILAERNRVVADLSIATAKQEETRSDDIAGVILLGLPVGSMSEENQAPRIARLKGERDALDRVTGRNNCSGLVASVEPEISSTGAESDRQNSKSNRSKMAAIPNATLTIDHNNTQKFLSTSNLKALFTRATVKFRSPNDNPGKMYFRPNGTMSGQVTSSINVHYDEGRWWLKEPDLICTRFRKWREGRAVCNKYLREGNTFKRYLEDGSLAGNQPEIRSSYTIALRGVGSSVGRSRSKPPRQSKVAAIAKPQVPVISKQRSPPKVVATANEYIKIPDGELSGEQIKQALKGKVVEKFTPTGRWTSSSVHFRADGRLSGESHNPGSNTEDQGVWSIGGGQKLCTRWDNWNYAARECYRVKKRGKQLLLFDSGSQPKHTYTVPN